MGQKPSGCGGRFNNNNNSRLQLSWIFRCQDITKSPTPEQPIKFQYNMRRKHIMKENKYQTKTNNIKTINNLCQSHIIDKMIIKNTNVNQIKCKIIKNENALNTMSEPNLSIERGKTKYQHRRQCAKIEENWKEGIRQFGYKIHDVDEFLNKATFEKPANIPVVLAFPTVLYQTRIGGYQDETILPLGMVVNAVFKNRPWLYIQTPHAEEGYISYAACLPLGIIPPANSDIRTPCWEKSTDVFPKPCGNMTDIEKLSSKSEYDTNMSCHSRKSWHTLSACEEQSVDKLYLKALASTKRRQHLQQTLLLVNVDYYRKDQNVLEVRKGEIVILLGTHMKGWFWVKNKEGHEGFIPATIAGHVVL